jgi:hypothetical protein
MKVACVKKEWKMWKWRLFEPHCGVLSDCFSRCL